MTRVAVLGPEHSGHEWWGVVEVAWSRREGPPMPELVIPMVALVPYTIDGTLTPSHELSLERLTVTFLALRMVPPSAVCWTASVSGAPEITRLLNIAYTCETHAEMETARAARMSFERIMGYPHG